MSFVKGIITAPAERLGLFRSALGVYLVVYFLAQLPGAIATASMSQAKFSPVGLVSWLGITSPLAPGFAICLYIACVLLSAAFAAGAYFSLTGPLCALLVFWVTSYKSSFSMIFHSENLFALQALLIGVSPAAKSLSVDAKRGRGSWLDEVPSGWPLFACCLISIVAYFLAGLAKLKLSGLDWATGEVLRVQVAYDNVRKLEFGSPHSPIGALSVQYAWLFPPLGLLTMFAEMGGPLALLHRRVALLWVALVVGFHWGVLLLMAITFSYPMSGVPFLCFFALERTKLGERVLGKLGQKSREVHPPLPEANTVL